MFKFEILIKIPSLELEDSKRRDQNRAVVQQGGHQGQQQSPLSRRFHKRVKGRRFYFSSSRGGRLNVPGSG